MLGNVKFFNEKKGWGFITGSDGKEVFVHYEDIKAEGFKTLKNNQSVTYDVAETDKGVKAVNVVPGDLPVAATSEAQTPEAE